MTTVASLLVQTEDKPLSSIWYDRLEHLISKDSFKLFDPATIIDSEASVLLIFYYKNKHVYFPDKLLLRSSTDRPIPLIEGAMPVRDLPVAGSRAVGLLLKKHRLLG